MADAIYGLVPNVMHRIDIFFKTSQNSMAKANAFYPSTIQTEK